MKNTMKPREGKGAPPADFHVCFPSRPQLTLTPKPLCSPARSNESSKRHHPHHPHHLTRRNNRGGQASPSLWANTNLNSSDGAEPTSPKVTCAGQIKVRAKKKNNSKNWQSVMEEIEKVHSKRSVHETVGFKKDMMKFFTSLRGFQCDLTCFHSITDSDANTSIEEEREVNIEDNSASGGSKAIFSKWYMVMQENKENQVGNDQVNREERDESVTSNVPPSNALLLMRCSGTPAKSLVEEEEEEREEEAKKARLVIDQEEKKESLILKCYAPDVANEKWIVGGMNDPFSRSRRWRRC